MRAGGQGIDGLRPTVHRALQLRHPFAEIRHVAVQAEVRRDDRRADRQNSRPNADDGPELGRHDSGQGLAVCDSEHNARRVLVNHARNRSLTVVTASAFRLTIRSLPCES